MGGYLIFSGFDLYVLMVSNNRVKSWFETGQSCQVSEDGLCCGPSLGLRGLSLGLLWTLPGSTLPLLPQIRLPKCKSLLPGIMIHSDIRINLTIKDGSTLLFTASQ